MLKKLKFLKFEFVTKVRNRCVKIIWNGLYNIAVDVRMRKHAHLIQKCQINLFWWRVIMSFGISVHWNGNSNWAVNWHSDIFAAFTWNKHINMFNHDLYIACFHQNMNIWTNIWPICILLPKTRNVIQKHKAYWI